MKNDGNIEMGWTTRPGWGTVYQPNVQHAMESLACGNYAAGEEFRRGLETLAYAVERATLIQLMESGDVDDSVIRSRLDDLAVRQHGPRTD